MITLSQTYSPIQSQNSVSHKFVTKFSDVLFTKFGDLENSSPNLVINPSQNLTLNTLKLIPHVYMYASLLAKFLVALVGIAPRRCTVHTLLSYFSSCPCHLFASVHAKQSLNASASKGRLHEKI